VDDNRYKDTISKVCSRLEHGGADYRFNRCC